MKTLFSVRNSTGEAWPAFAMARLGALVMRDGVNSDLPLYTLLKPDGQAGVYIVNGASPLASGNEGAGIHYIDAQRVSVKESLVVALDDVIGAVADQWEAGNGGAANFLVLDEKNEHGVATVVSIGSSGGSHEVWAVIVDVQCNYDSQKVEFVLATPIRYTNGCSLSQIPDIDPYGMILVESICEDIFTEYYTSDQLIGKTIRATWMYPLDAAYCQASWILDGVCGQPRCA